MQQLELERDRMHVCNEEKRILETSMALEKALERDRQWPERCANQREKMALQKGRCSKQHQLQKKLGTEQFKVDERRQVLEAERRAVLGKARELADARRLALLNLVLEQKMVSELVQQASEVRELSKESDLSRDLCLPHTKALTEIRPSHTPGATAFSQSCSPEPIRRALEGRIVTTPLLASGPESPLKFFGDSRKPLAATDSSPSIHKASLLLVNSDTPVRQGAAIAIPFSGVGEPSSRKSDSGAPVGLDVSVVEDPVTLQWDARFAGDLDLECGGACKATDEWSPLTSMQATPARESYANPLTSVAKWAGPTQEQLEFFSPSPSKDFFSPQASTPLALTRGLARQLLEELSQAVGEQSPTGVLEHFGLGKGPEAWVQVEQAMQPHFDQDCEFRRQWLEHVRA